MSLRMKIPCGLDQRVRFAPAYYRVGSGVGLSEGVPVDSGEGATEGSGVGDVLGDGFLVWWVGRNVDGAIVGSPVVIVGLDVLTAVGAVLGAPVTVRLPDGNIVGA